MKNKIYEIVKKIPVGKVVTYGQIAQGLGNKNLCRVVGNVLHSNPDPANIPCHRVVNAKGELSQMYAFGGLNAQKEKLISEGVEVEEDKVDLTKYRF